MTNLGFTGEQTDPSGLQYLRARYYDPRTAMFLSRDPSIGAYPTLSASWNGYGYAHGNPVMYADPSGEFPLLFAAAVLFGGTAIGGVSYAAWDVSVNQGIGLGGHNQFNIGAIDWDRASGAFRTGANTGMFVSSIYTGARVGFSAAKMGAGAARYLAAQNALDFSFGVAADMAINGDSFGEAALWNAVGFGAGEVFGAGVELVGRGVGRGIRSVRRSVSNFINSPAAARLSLSPFPINMMFGTVRPQQMPLFPSSPLLKNEGLTDLYMDLGEIPQRLGLDRHHMPSDLYMTYHAPDVNNREIGVAMFMQSSRNGRHQATHSFGKTAASSANYLALSPREALLLDILDVQNIYKANKLYTSQVRQGLLDVIRLNYEHYPDLFDAHTRLRNRD